MNKVMKTLVCMLTLPALQSWGQAVDTEEYYLCAHKVSNTTFDYGTIPAWCDVDPFGSPDIVKQHFNDIMFNGFESEDTERQRYMSALYPTIREAAEYYLDIRKPSASITEKAAWQHAVMATASVETKWSHYLNYDQDERIKMIRGDSGHGHGMMQIDDRWHFSAISEGKGMQIFENMVYALDIFYNGWRYSVAQSCVNGENDWEARSRSAYSAYNGGPTDWCRWQESPITQDTNFSQNYSAKAWEALVADKNASASLDVTCYMEDNMACIDAADDGGTKLRIGLLSTGSLGALLDNKEGTRLEYIRGPENAYQAADRFLELERDGEWVKVELMKYNTTDETPLIGWVHDVGNITWTDVKAVGSLKSSFPATVLELQDDIDGSFISEYVISYSNAWNPADRVVLLQRSDNWVQVEVLRFLDNSETPLIGWVPDNGNFDWVEGSVSLTQQIGELTSGTLGSLLDDIDGTRLEYIRGPENAYQAADRFLLLARDGDWAKVELMKFNDTTETPLIGWVLDAGTITWTEAQAVGSLKQDYAATVLELHDAVNGAAQGQYVISYSNAWNPADRVKLLEENGDWLKVEVLRYLDKDETPNIGWVLGKGSFDWIGGVDIVEEPTDADLWQYRYLGLATGETCILELGEFHCVENMADALCLNTMFDRVTEEEVLPLDSETSAAKAKVLHDRHECLATVPYIHKVGDSIQTMQALSLYAQVGGADLGITTEAEGIYQILDVVALGQNVYNQYYKVSVNDTLGYIYAGSEISPTDVYLVEHDMLPTSSIIIPQVGDTLKITQGDGIALRDDTDVSGKVQALVNFDKEVQVEETIIKGQDNRVYYKVTYQNVLGFMYGGMLSANENTLAEWAVYTEPTPIEPPVTPPTTGDKEVEVRPLASGGSLDMMLAFIALCLFIRSRRFS
ncbi:hypothetical protein L0668_06845 [Paraglaciecola aquimarina]|uniref:LysM domain-containing protein n=1 Tax=Paraglaciecola algarum TaxID=3050085 RepID=A0ABS9D824_9ALTE|nr:hypothetical protein [Paraglaciecola sp. G1-23]MCF2947816.1 hypothetical protein [Paraglaciecola sp. G1-23]